MTARYALYYAPSGDDPLQQAASAWLGRNAFSEARPARREISGLDGIDLDALTEDARSYGFHATLKAPFELAADVGEADLISALHMYASTRQPFDIKLAVSTIGPFLAFRLAEPSAEMQALHEDAVRLFERFRAPLSAFDYERRRRPGMSERQERQLREFGYPGVFDDFRFHMTLTGPIPDEAVRTRVLAALQRHFAIFEKAHRVAGLSLFRQPDREADFMAIEQATFPAP